MRVRINTRQSPVVIKAMQCTRNALYETSKYHGKGPYEIGSRAHEFFLQQVKIERGKYVFEPPAEEGR